MVLLLGLLQVSCGLEWLEPEIVPPPESTYSSGTGTLLHEVGETQEVRLARVTPEFFEVLGQPWLGRAIIARDCEEDATSVVVLSHALWTEDFAGSRQVVGRGVVLDGREHTILGVMPEATAWPPGVQLWVPRRSQARSQENQPAVLGAQPQRSQTVSIHYLEIVTRDVDSACALYEELHGLAFGPPDQDLGGARVAEWPDGSLVGIRAPLAEHESPVVRTYLAVEDIEKAAKAAEERGATVAYPPTRQGERGTFAIFFEGDVQHGLWQP